MKPYRPLFVLTTATTVFMLAFAVAQLAIVGANASGAFDEDAAMGLGAAFLSIGLLGLFVFGFLLSVIFFCVWLNRAAHNVRALGHSGFETSPAFAVGSFFIPFLNLWKPYQATQEIWQASSATSNETSSWLSSPRSELIKAWWAAWIFSGIAGRISWKVESTTVDLVAAGLTWLAAILCVTMMRQVMRAQDEQARRRTHAPSVSDAVAHTPYLR
ncbi:MAG: DUF4328 domain-containing protein [Deltaproteobacteria bacterium]|nr:DUF4328 domain-containing protein [Deltaproteobacteria bacterium]